MFCPNCGKDCQGAKFCPECGQNLGEVFVERKTDVVSCPRCSSMSVNAVMEKHSLGEYRLYHGILAKLLVFIERLWDSAEESTYGPRCVCLQCGYQWLPKEAALKKQHQINMEKLLKGNEQMVVMTADGHYFGANLSGVMLYVKRKFKTGIPHDQIVAVQLQESQEGAPGWLSVRHVGNSKKPFPATIEEAKKDKTTFLFDEANANDYHEIHDALKVAAEINRNAGWIPV